MPPKKSTSAAKRARSPDATPTGKDADSASVHSQKRSKTTSQDTPRETVNIGASSESLVVTPSPPALAGKFDLYMMDLPFLSKAYMPAGKSEPQFEELYQAILKVQEKRDYTARCLLPQLPSTANGKFIDRGSCDPMEQMPFDIAIEDLKLVDDLAFSAAERSKFLTPPQKGPGITGRLELADSNCGVQFAAGKFRMKHVRTVKGPEGADVEIFEGYLSFKVSYSGLYKRKGHGPGSNRVFAYWAVRGRRDTNGEEIGL